ncbi:MAG: glycoside hydrolase domain-containing protein [Pseudomonadota bacterium]
MPLRALCLALALCASAALADSRAAIIDTAFDTRLYLDRILGPDKGVLVIGRYYARCKQPQNWARAKRLIDQGLPRDPGSEVSEIARRSGAILSIYQFYSNHPAKFDGMDKDGAALPDASCNWDAARPRSAEEEARLDADAAIDQARQMGQPQGSAIYFGVDFNLKAGDAATQDKVVRYFQVIRTRMDQAGYRTGAYGNGHTLEVLKGRGLIDFAWIMASRSFHRSSAYHRSGRWTLFQNQVNREWFTEANGACRWGLPIDTNVQNPAAPDDIGFWRPQARFAVPYARTRAVYDARRFVCNGDAVLRKSASSTASDIVDSTYCTNNTRTKREALLWFANSVRVGETSPSGHTVQVDMDGDGTWDGWTWHGNLSRDFGAKPDWIASAGARSSATCP